MDEIVQAGVCFSRRQMEEPHVQIEILPHSELAIERKRLRHVADAPARVDVMRVRWLAEQERLAIGRRQQAGEHLHGRGLAAAVRADEAEYLSALDGEAHAINGGKIAKTAGEVARRDHRFGVEDAQRRYFQPAAPGADSFRQQRGECVLDRLRMGLRLELGWRTHRQDFAGIHSDERIEPLGLLHVGGRHQDAHAGTPRAHAVDQFPELAPRQRVDAGRWLVENQKIGIVNERAAQAEFLPHAARKLLGRTIGEWRESRAVQNFRDAPLPLGAGLPK